MRLMSYVVSLVGAMKSPPADEPELGKHPNPADELGNFTCLIGEATFKHC
jgi:hypothetical protein